jgi:hypothetical protein
MPTTRTIHRVVSLLGYTRLQRFILVDFKTALRVSEPSTVANNVFHVAADLEKNIS